MRSNARGIAHLEAGGCLVTPNLRQSRIFRRLHDRAQLAAGRAVWPSAQVLPFDDWLLQQWRECAAVRADLPQPLPLVALRWLWRDQVRRDSQGLMDPAELGNRARTNWLMLRAYGGTIDEVARFPLTRDQQAFVDWSRGAERELRDRGACDAVDLPRLIVESGVAPDPGPPLLLAGFRRLAPAQSALVETLKANGWSVEQLEPDLDGNLTATYAATDPEAERSAMLDWLRRRLDRRPDGLHALIVPDLERARGALERALEASLQPELELPVNDRRERVFDLAGGPPLSAQPVAQCAIEAIACASGEFDWSLVSRLLRSPYLAGARAERNARVRLDLDLRCAPLVSRISPGALIARATASGVSQFTVTLKAAVAALAGPRRRGAGAWAEGFGACLAAWGWPGEIPLASQEFQSARQFREILRELAALASVAPEIGVNQALGELCRLAQIPFQPESGEPAVFVLDAYDDPGLRFDSLWVAGLTAAAWPRPVAIEPLLPIEVQRRLAMPRVTPEASVDEARAIMDRWRAGADKLVMSWPCRENDTEVDGTPLVPEGTPKLERPVPHATRERLVLAAARLESLADSGLPPLQGIAHGGARVIELQSHCPFRAFAQLRLQAEPLEEPVAGVDRRLRGIVLHRALQSFWNELGSQRSLVRLADQECADRVRAAIERALAEALPAGSGARTVALERDWQRRAIGHLLELERARADYTIVETERSLTGRIGGLELKLRVDRIDRVGSDLIVIDYKSGAVRKAPWRGARMDAPQLPLYAVLHPSRPAGIAIAELGADGATFKGVARSEGIIDSLELAPDFELTEARERGFAWEVITERWYAWLERLARDHAEGRADVDPKLGAETCRSCHLSSLCRVTAVPPDDAEADEAGDEG